MTEAQLNGALSALRALLIAVGVWAVQNGLSHTGWYEGVELVASALLVVGPTLWGMWVAVAGLVKAHQAGINAAFKLIEDGKALDIHGAPIQVSATLKPVTAETTKQIMATGTAPPPA